MKNTKRVVSLIMTTVMLLSLFTMSVSANDEIKVFVNGQQLQFDVPPQTVNYRTMVPLRAIFEAIGAKVDWYESTQTVLASGAYGKKVSITLNSNTMYVNGTPVALDAPAFETGGRTLVPVRAISEAFGAKVDWYEDTQIVEITIIRCKDDEHKWVEGTCTTPKKCSVCMLADKEVTGHKFGDWITVKAVSCAGPGKNKRICSVCKYTEYAEIPVPATMKHKEGEWKTYTTSDNVEIKELTCSECGKVIKTERREKSKEEVKTDYKKQCKRYYYSEIARYPDMYKGMDGVVRGQVLQVIEYGNEIDLRVSISQSKYGGWDTGKFIYVSCDKSATGGIRILEEDIVSVYGKLAGLFTYTTVRDTRVTVPSIDAKIVELFSFPDIKIKSLNESGNSTVNDYYYYPIPGVNIPMYTSVVGGEENRKSMQGTLDGTKYTYVCKESEDSNIKKYTSVLKNELGWDLIDGSWKNKTTEKYRKGKYIVTVYRDEKTKVTTIEILVSSKKVDESSKNEYYKDSGYAGIISFESVTGIKPSVSDDRSTDDVVLGGFVYDVGEQEINDALNKYNSALIADGWELFKADKSDKYTLDLTYIKKSSGSTKFVGVRYTALMDWVAVFNMSLSF